MDKETIMVFIVSIGIGVWWFASMRAASLEEEQYKLWVAEKRGITAALFLLTLKRLGIYNKYHK